MDLFLSKRCSTPTGKNNISAEVMPFDSPCVRFIMLPPSSEQAGSSFPRLRGALLIYKTLKLVLLAGKKKHKGDSLILFSRRTSGHRTWHLHTHKCYFMRARPVYGGLLQIYVHYPLMSQSFVTTRTETVPGSLYLACSGSQLAAIIAGFPSEEISLISFVFLSLQPSEPQRLKASPTARVGEPQTALLTAKPGHNELRRRFRPASRRCTAAAHSWKKTANSRRRKSKKKVSITPG